MRGPEHPTFTFSDMLVRARLHPGPATRFLPAVALGVYASLLAGCSGPSDSQAVADVVIQWHKAFVNDTANSCKLLTQSGQDDLRLAIGATTCQEAVKLILKTFTSQDREGFLNVSADPGKVQLEGERALLAAGAISYKPEVTDFLRLDGPVTFTRIDNQWRIDTVVYLPEH